MQNTSLTRDKELNILIIERLPMSLCKKLYTLKNGPVFWPTLYTKHYIDSSVYFALSTITILSS